MAAWANGTLAGADVDAEVFLGSIFFKTSVTGLGSTACEWLGGGAHCLHRLKHLAHVMFLGLLDSEFAKAVHQNCGRAQFRIQKSLPPFSIHVALQWSENGVEELSHTRRAAASEVTHARGGEPIPLWIMAKVPALSPCAWG